MNNLGDKLYMIIVYSMFAIFFGSLAMLGLVLIYFLWGIAVIFPIQASIILGLIIFLWISYKFFGERIRNIMNEIGALILVIVSIYMIVRWIWLGYAFEYIIMLVSQIVIYAIVVGLIWLLFYLIWGRNK